MKKTICFCLGLMALLTVEAKSLVITLNNGQLVYYLLSNNQSPVMRMIPGGFTVNADTYQYSDVKNFYISQTDDPNPADPPVDIQQITSLIDQYLQVGSTVTVADITALIAKYLEQR